MNGPPPSPQPDRCAVLTPSRGEGAAERTTARSVADYLREVEDAIDEAGREGIWGAASGRMKKVLCAVDDLRGAVQLLEARLARLEGASADPDDRTTAA